MTEDRSPARQAESPTRGRPRDATREVAILDAALALLVEVGYDQLSIEGVAGRAGVGKATIYRRYSDKAALVAAAVDRRATRTPPELPTGDLREALLSTVAWLAQEISEQQVGLLGALFAGMRSDPALAAAMRRILHRDQAALAKAPFGSVNDPGMRPAPGAALLLAEIATAMIVHRVVVAGGPTDRAFVEHIVDDVLLLLVN